MPRISESLKFMGKRITGHLWQVKTYRMPPLSLCYLAALTPGKHDVAIIDENFEEVKLDGDEDLIGISVYTPMANRAYELCKEVRLKTRAKIVLGSYHVSMLPKEALKYCDAVVVGEAEGLWENVLQDAEKGKLKKVYQHSDLPCLDFLPIPKRVLLNKYQYFCDTIQTSRGCPIGCNFCIIHKFLGQKTRVRPIEKVREELFSIKKEHLGIVDDNIVGNIEYASNIFKLLSEFDFHWFTQASVHIAKNDYLLKLAAESGCDALFIGFESINQDSLMEAHKFTNKMEEYKMLIKKIHDWGIGVEGAFVFGFDSDKKDIFRRTMNFCNENELEMAQFTALTPLPGTELFKKMKDENRIFTFNWNYYDVLHPVFTPKSMKAHELFEGVLNCWSEFYSGWRCLRRMFEKRGGSWSFWFNFDSFKMFTLLKFFLNNELDRYDFYKNLKMKNI